MPSFGRFDGGALGGSGNDDALLDGDTARTHARLIHVFEYSGSAAVLPRDYSSAAGVGLFGPSMSGPNLPWANSGYLRTYAAGGSSYYQAPAAATAGVNVDVDSWALFFTLNRAPVAGSGADTILGCSDGSGIPGFILVMGQASHPTGANRIGARFIAGGASQLSGTYASGTVADSTDRRVCVNYDAAGRVLRIRIDGVLQYTSPTLTAAAGDIYTGALRLGMALAGASLDCLFGDSLQFYVFKGSGLPLNFASLAAFDNANRKSGIVGEPVFI